MNTKNTSTGWLYLSLLLLLGFVSGCREEDPGPLSPNARINDWILEEMKFWYLWNTEIPASTDKSLAPDAYFESLLVDEDRFSWIQDNYQELLNSLKGVSKEGGYEFVLYQESPGSTNVIAQILYIKPGSPADNAGLNRGDVISHINAQRLTTANYQELVRGLGENHTIRFRPLVVEEERFDAEQDVSLTVVEYAENPNYLHKVITIDDKKIGYFVYNFFAAGPNETSQVYDTEMESVFADFKAQGITDLVLDLRFNSGGSESSANNLASHIGKGIDNTKIFARREYNQEVEDVIINDPRFGVNFLQTKFENKASNIGNQLNDGRVYILTSDRTASASELVINALKPFMEVFLIGEVTYGKNVGSVSLYDDEDPSNTWGMQPIVVKVYNSLNQSDYSNGFNPDVIHPDNNLYLYPLGDTREALLSAAIGQITGTATSGRIAPRGTLQTPIGHSLDNKRRSFNLVIDKDVPSGIIFRQ